MNTQGLTTFGGAVGSGTALVSVATDAGGTTAIDGGSITTSGPAGQVFNDAVTLGNDATLTANNAGAVTFATTLDGAKALAVNTQGLTTFGGAVGTTTSLFSLTTDAGGTTAINGGSITTSGLAGQVFNDAVTLGNDAALLANNAGAVTFATALDGAKTLAVNTQGLTTFGGAVGTTTPLVSLTTDAGGTTAINGGSIKTSGLAGQVFNDAVTLGANAILSAAAGAITLSSTLDGGFAATLSTLGTTTLGGVVGDATPLVSLVANAGGPTVIGGGRVTTTGNQTYADAVTLSANATLTGVDVRFSSTVDGSGGLVVNASGVTFFDAAVGATTPLAAVTTSAAGTTVIGGGSARTSGSQSWLDDVVLTADTVFTSTGGSITAGPANVFGASGRDVSFTAATGIGTAAAPIRIAAGEVTALVTDSGDIHIVGVGDLVIGADGFVAPGAIAINASGDIRVPDGGRIAAGRGVTAGKTVLWSVTRTTDAGAGSLRQVISNANVSGVEGRVLLDGPSLPGDTVTILVGSALPRVATRLTIDTTTGRKLVLDGGGTVATGLFFGPQSTGSLIAGVTLRNFAENAIVLDASPGVTVRGCVIQANGNGIQAFGNQAGSRIVGNTFTGTRAYGIHLYAATGLEISGNTVIGRNTLDSMGLYATGTLTKTFVVNNTFRGGLRGALLQNARGLAFGRMGQGNTLSDNVAVPSRPTFAGTGIRAEGDMTGTTVTANTFSRNNYGFGFVGARGLRLTGNTFVRNSIAGIHVDGNNTGSSQAANTFGSGVNSNKATIIRARGSRGI